VRDPLTELHASHWEARCNSTGRYRDQLDGLGSADIVKTGDAAGGDFAGSSLPDAEIADAPTATRS